MISLPRLDGTAMKSKWFTALEQHGTVISADEISLAALPAWIAARMKRQGQSADADTLAFLAQRVEGNLLAAFQEIQKLALLFPAGPLSFDQVKDSVMDVARYDVFKLSEAMLAGDAERYARILDGLRAEGTATVLILWATGGRHPHAGESLARHAAERQPVRCIARCARVGRAAETGGTRGAPLHADLRRTRLAPGRADRQAGKGPAPGRCMG